MRFAMAELTLTREVVLPEMIKCSLLAAFVVVGTEPVLATEMTIPDWPAFRRTLLQCKAFEVTAGLSFMHTLIACWSE